MDEGGRGQIAVLAADVLLMLLVYVLGAFNVATPDRCPSERSPDLHRARPPALLDKTSILFKLDSEVVIDFSCYAEGLLPVVGKVRVISSSLSRSFWAFRLRTRLSRELRGRGRYRGSRSGGSSMAGGV